MTWTPPASCATGMRPGPSKLRIVFLASSMEIVGGQEQYISQQIVNLDKSRWEPVLCCLKTVGPMAAPVLAAGIPVISGFQRFKYDLASLLRLAKFLRKQKPAILYIFDFRNVLFIGRLAALLAGRPLVVIASHKMNYRHTGRSFKWLDLLLMPLTDHVIAAAHAHRESLIANDRIPPHKVTAIHNGIQLSRLAADLRHPLTKAELGIPPDAKVVGTVARLSPEKSLSVLLRAAVLVSRAVPATHLVFVGDGPQRMALEQEAASLGIGERVHFLGIRKRVAPIVRHFDVFALPSSTSELFSAATLEAMALRIPAVVTDVGSMREMVVPDVTGHLVPSDDPQALADALIRVLRNSGEAGRMGAAARARVESLFTAEREVAEIQALFEALLAARRPRGRQPRGSESASAVAGLVD